MSLQRIVSSNVIGIFVTFYTLCINRKKSGKILMLHKFAWIFNLRFLHKIDIQRHRSFWLWLVHEIVLYHFFPKIRIRQVSLDEILVRKLYQIFNYLNFQGLILEPISVEYILCIINTEYCSWNSLWNTNEKCIASILSIESLVYIATKKITYNDLNITQRKTDLYLNYMANNKPLNI